jgi:hypothetical protein
MKNDTNNFTKRNSKTIKSILDSNNFKYDLVENLGDCRTFVIKAEGTIQNNIILKKNCGFIINERNDKYFIIKTF